MRGEAAANTTAKGRSAGNHGVKSYAIRLPGGNLRDRAHQGVERVERVSRRRFDGSAASRRSAGTKCTRADGSSVRQRESVVREHAGNSSRGSPLPAKETRLE